MRKFSLSLLANAVNSGYDLSERCLSPMFFALLTCWHEQFSKVFAFFSLACVSSETHNLQRVFRPGGVVPYIGCIGMCRAKTIFFSRFGLKYGINFDHFGLKQGMACAF